MLEEMIAFLKERRLGVLATSFQDQPHCSLMAFVTDETGRLIYMATRKDTTKHDNMTRNQRVSFLVDDRAGAVDADIFRGRSLTVAGVCRPVTVESEKIRVMAELLARHPYLSELLADNEVEIISLAVASLLFMNGPLVAHYRELAD